MGSKRFYVVRVQLDSVTVAVTCAALLAGVVVAFKNELTPYLVFALIACYSILMALVGVSRPSGFYGFFELFRRGGISNLGATVGANLAQPTALAVFRHWFAADGARNHDTHALSAHLVSLAKIVGALAAYLAFYADAPSICLGASGAGNAGCVFDRLAQGRNRRGWLAALSTRSKGGAVAIITNAVVSAVYSALDASVLCHTAIIPQLPDLEKSV